MGSRLRSGQRLKPHRCDPAYVTAEAVTHKQSHIAIGSLKPRLHLNMRMFESSKSSASAGSRSQPHVCHNRRMNQPARDIQRAELPNGVLIVTEKMPHVRSVSVGIWLATGSRAEPSERNGIAHFIEHMLFK